MTVAATNLPKEARARIELAEVFRRYGTTFILVVLVIGAMSQSNAFLTPRNILNVLRQVAPTGIMAVGMLFVILTRGIDLSVGSLLALGSVTCTSAIVGEHGTALSVAAGLGAGASAGLVTGVLVAYAQLPPFVITLAMMTAGARCRAHRLRRPADPDGRAGRDADRVRRGLSVRRAAAGAADVRGVHRRRPGAGLHQVRPAGEGDRVQRGGGAAVRHRRPPATSWRSI